MDRGTKNIKIWKATRTSAAGFMVDPEKVVMAGTKSNFLVIDKYGTNIAGPISFMTTSEQIRQGGLFVQMPDFLQMIPSTMMTPIPSLVPVPPIAVFLAFAKMMPAVLAMAGSV